MCPRSKYSTPRFPFPFPFSRPDSTGADHPATAASTLLLFLRSLALYYEIHGCPNESAERRLVLVMGLNTSCFAWKRAVQHYSQPSRRTQVLVFDNRGVGFSDTPPSPRFYKTTELAKDAIDLLDALGWTSRIHLAGVSMGGMIAQHLCDMCPKRFSSLVLISTTPGRRPWQLPRLPTCVNPAFPQPLLAASP